MFFKNLTLFRFPKSAADSYRDNRQNLADHPLKPVGPFEMSSRGWISPFGRGEEVLAHELGHYALLTLGSDEKLLPAAVVNEFLADKIEALTEERGKPPGGRERKRLRDDALTELLPRAFSKPGRLSGYLDLKYGWTIVDTVSRKSAEGFLTGLRDALGSFPAVPLDPQESPPGLMTEWLAGAKLPEGFELGDECELKDPADKGSLVRGKRLDLESAEVREHLKTGKQVSQLGLVVDGRVSFVLGDDLTVRRLKFLDVVTEELESTDRESPKAELDARFALMSLTVEPVLQRLDDVFRLPRPRDR